MKRKIIIGSRGSELALWQANFVLSELQRINETAEIKIIKTQGDKIQHLSLDKLEGKGFFTKEIEDSLLANETDLAVHSHKDLPTTSPEGLKIGAVSYREDPSELLLINKNAFVADKKLFLIENAVVGSSSARRKSQLLSMRKDIKIKDIRGNVPTRVQKLREGNFDAIILAAAGASRLKLDLSDFEVIKLDTLEFVPAPAQGVLALQIRENDSYMQGVLSKLNNSKVAKTIEVERKILNMFDGGCHLPLGAYCIEEDGKYKVWATKADSWDAFPVRVFLESETTEGLAEKVVKKIQSIQPKSVFITRNLNECDFFTDTLKGNGFHVNGQSLIDIHAFEYSVVPETSWVFFSSKNGVKHFFSRNPQINDNTKFGAVGSATANALLKFNKKADFVGEGNDTSKIGKEFASIINGDSVLFPMAKDSLRTVQKQLKDASKAFDLPVYKVDERKDVEIPETDIVILTSPSNAITYCKAKKIEQGTIIIVVGTSTAEKLQNLGYTNYIIANSFEERGLLETVFSL